MRLLRWLFPKLTKPTFTLKLSHRADGLGFFYGSATLGNRTVRVDVLTPGVVPGESLWLVHVDGEPIGKARWLSEADFIVRQHMEKM